MTVFQSPTEALTRGVYLALMWSLSYPGRAHALPVNSDGFMDIARTLLDLETSFFCADDALAAQLAETGARRKPIDQAAYVFVPNLDEAALLLTEQLSIGTLSYPDLGATLVAGAIFDAGTLMTWSGPGIEYPRRAMIGGIAAGFWDIRSSRIHYPLGFDVLFVDHGQVLGLPRTTTVEVA